MKLIIVLLIMFASIFTYSCGEAEKEAENVAKCTNPCTQEEHADSRCKTDKKAEVCTHTRTAAAGDCWQWVEKECKTSCTEQNGKALCM